MLWAELIRTIVLIALGMAGLGAAAGLLSIVVLALMNMWGILDPRMGQSVKGNLVKVGLSLALLAAASAGGVAAMQLG